MEGVRAPYRADPRPRPLGAAAVFLPGQPDDDALLTHRRERLRDDPGRVRRMTPSTGLHGALLAGLDRVSVDRVSPGLAAPHLYPDEVPPLADPELRDAVVPRRAPKRWVPKPVLITRSAAPLPLAQHGRALRGAGCGGRRAQRRPHHRAAHGRRAHHLAPAKSTLAVVVAPPPTTRLQPIPPSADWRVDLATGCPAHRKYCYLAGSLTGPPVTRVHANLPELFGSLRPPQHR